MLCKGRIQVKDQRRAAKGPPKKGHEVVQAGEEGATTRGMLGGGGEEGGGCHFFFFGATERNGIVARAQTGQRVTFGLISKRRRKREVEGTS